MSIGNIQYAAHVPTAASHTNGQPINQHYANGR
jgi:hypothetical protein